MESPDLQTKYQKLAAEYSKLRSQIPILKKGVLDEQAKSQAFKDEVKNRDQAVRKYEQEVDSLTFRNEQLTKRVRVLQDELDGSKNSKSKHKGPEMVQNVNTSFPPSVFDEELRSKIEENAQLHKEVYDTKIEHNRSLSDLKRQLSVYEQDASTHERELESLSAAFKSQVDSLLEEKALVEVKLLSIEGYSRELQSRADSAELQLSSISAELTFLPSSSSYDDFTSQKSSASVQSFAALPDDQSYKDKIPSIVGEAGGLVRELTHSLSNFHSYSEQRSTNYPDESIRDTTKKFCAVLKESGAKLRPIDAALRVLADQPPEAVVMTLPNGLSEFSSKCHVYSEYLFNILPLQIQCLEAENLVCSSKELRLKNKELISSFTSFTNILKKSDSSLHDLAQQYRAISDDKPLTVEKQYRDLLISIQTLNDTLRDLSKIYNAKVSLEQKLLNSTPKFKTADECVVSSLISLVTVSGKLVQFLKSNMESVIKVNIELSADTTKSEVYIPDSGNINIYQQVSSLREKMAALEQDKEQWMLESQLIQAKYEKERQRASELESKLGLVSDDLESNMASAASDTISIDSDNRLFTDLSALGTSTKPRSDSEPNLREKLIKDYYSTRISDLTAQLHLADSKAVNFYYECQNLHKRLHAADKGKNRLQSELDISNEDTSQLKDDLSTTTKSYEDQMGLMSEHIAELNDKLTRHKDELDALRHHQSSSKMFRK